MLDKQLPLWNHAAITVLDVRRCSVEPGDDLMLRLPASAFLYANGGRGQLRLDGAIHAIAPGHVWHAGKGASMNIVRVTEAMDYFLIYYKAVLVPPYRRHLLDLYRDSNPFRDSYGFVPANPLRLLTKIEQMHLHWGQGDPLAKFHVRALFHQLVFELLRQRQQAEPARDPRGDLIERAVRLMEQHYVEPFSLDDLANDLQCGVRQLQRLFKAHYGISPMEYLIRLRMEKAKELLLRTSAPIADIAEAVGYPDAYHFSRYFKKHSGVPPLQYRRSGRNNPFSPSLSSIGSEEDLSYSNVDDENHYQQTGRGVARMNSRTRTLVTVNFLLVLMLLLGACSLGGNNNGANNASPSSAASTTPAPSASAAAETPQSSYPVTIKHVKGDFTLEQKPENIAVLDVQYVDQLVALNEQPAGSVKAAGSDADFPEYLSDKLSDVKVLGTYEEPNLEAIVAMNPDLIICTEVHEEIYESLNKIAPTIMLIRNDDWRDTLSTFGKIMGKESEAEQLVEAYKEKTAKLSSELAAKLDGQTVSLIRPRDDAIRVHTGDHRTGAILYKDLGLPAPKMVSEVDDTSFNVSLESLAEVDADHYFLLTDDMFGELVKEFQSTATWQSLEAAKNNRVYTVDTTMWIGYYGPVAINLVVDEIARYLLGTS
ncbi:AraC family transcriptional regulator [Cohnella thailandensis]|uniref:AraC family transcriptional regulator n=1 Tax=Cohnella thailandensis TaxID=557557 RepID=A0A841SQE5_9BACL|nr:AraC family transcriptional regulator [Cohnella thailandensis]MBB6633089.1 AraC family transcriptional regulator [Cohnella thailandensis]MBP1975216.1 iron complex transport system substrate-binding protein [Cohnella thailandensis]